MKKLDLLIVKTFLGPFIITFFVAVFVLVMQILWKYIDDLVGKGLDFFTIAKFVWYASASLLALAMPIAILISSIMTFGNLGESFELVAIKSSGISLLRFMRPLVVITLGLCYVTFLFANYVIPYSQLKFFSTYNDIYFKKPAFELKEGAFFTTIPNYAIRVGKKDKDGKTIRNVLVYEQGNALQDNTITAQQGTMAITPDQNFLEFNLKDGFRYQERGNYNDTSTEYIRLRFKEYKKLFDLSSFQKTNTPDSFFKDNNKMLSARQLGKQLVVLRKNNDSANLVSVNRLEALLPHLRMSDSLYALAPQLQKFEIPDSAIGLVNTRSGIISGEIWNNLVFNNAESLRREKEINNFEMEWHERNNGDTYKIQRQIQGSTWCGIGLYEFLH